MNSEPSSGGVQRAQPETFRGRSLQASLTVRDLRQSVAWYRDVMGFHVGRQYERAGTPFAVQVMAGAVQLLLTQDDGKRGIDRARGEGFSLQIQTAQDVDELARRIKERGATLATEPADVMGARAFRLVDLDGFKLTISSER
jgi:catechol 2,3-dioxygenase-like lactoylglutathione lyase family enzyme